MFIRETKTYNKKTDTTYITHRLVESYRTDKGVRQRVVLNLGTLSLPKSQWRDLAIVLESKLSGQQQMFEISPELYKVADKAIQHSNLLQKHKNITENREGDKNLLQIDINSIQTQEHRSLGPEIVASDIWGKLEFDNILKQCNFSKEEINIAKIVILGRLIYPSSDFDTWRWIKTRTSLPELISVDADNISKNKIYEIADLLLSYKEKIEFLLRKKEDFLFPRGETIYLNDLTNTYFEANCLSNELAKRGKCKSKRTDCPLVTLALIVDSYGFPIFSEIYPGNQSEPETLENILNRLEKNRSNDIFGLIKPTIAMDRGIATSDNIDLLEKLGYNYVLIERRAVEKEYLEEFKNAKENFLKIENKNKTAFGEKNSIYLKKIECNDKKSRVLCLSEGRKQKEFAINELKETRFLSELEGLKRSIEKNRYVNKQDKVNERIGRIKQKYSSVSKCYTINNEKSNEKITAINWERKINEKKDDNDILYGCYVIETTHKEMDSYEIWKLYTTLTRVESAFKALKSELGMRPVYHQNSERTQGHLFISVLAYHFLATIGELLEKAGDTREWTTIKTILSTHQRSTIILTDKDNVIHHVRVSGNPELQQKEIYEKLNIKNPLKTDHRIAKNQSVVT